MRKIFILLTLSVLLLSSCKKDRCIGSTVVCANGGHCDENTGNCVCEYGYSGIDCSIAPQPCAQNHYGTLILVNTHSDPYNVYRNGLSYSYQSSYSTTTWAQYPSQSNSWRFVQASGYVFYPTEYTASSTVSDCSTKTIAY